ncbi:putative ATP-grasp superfamily ATP-dependent carboligase [Mesorhizobium sp. RMAD-H1]|nr:ATP-grasp domain-containing protein [Mesorhizobium sp. RMAD-H1]MBB2970389.1 putative ATP-grasp superfamily ATP-dependent carboligase [Mesorhizobium sp. RMAD-H1]
MPVTLQNNPTVLIAAISGRSLAAAARRAGLRPLVADLFNDSDTLRLAERAIRLPGSIQTGIEPDGLVERLAALADGDEPQAFIYGSGFERTPEMVDAIARRFFVAGNSARTIRAVKDPAGLAGLCASLGIPHPEISMERPERPDGWLVKLAGGAGGSHVAQASSPEIAPHPYPLPACGEREASALPSHSSSQHPAERDGETSMPPSPRTRGEGKGEGHSSERQRFRLDGARPGRYFQRFVAGKNISALFIADGKEARLIGFSRQWSAPSETSPYRYGGAVRLLRCHKRKRTQISEWLTALTARTGLVGLCAADFIDGAAGLWLIEINPRPGATLDIFDSAETPLLREHLNAVRGATVTPPAYTGSVASAIAYTPHPIRLFPPIEWPDMTADHQPPGSMLEAGDPVCTVFASARSAATAERAVKTRVRALAAHWKEGSP